MVPLLLLVQSILPPPCRQLIRTKLQQRHAKKIISFKFFKALKKILISLPECFQCRYRKGVARTQE
jgi:hypothetical protein